MDNSNRSPLIINHSLEKPQSPARSTSALKTQKNTAKIETPKKPATPLKAKLEELDKMIENVLNQVDENKVARSRSSSVRAVASQGSYMGKRNWHANLQTVKNDEEKTLGVVAPVYVQGGNTVDVESR